MITQTDRNMAVKAETVKHRSKDVDDRGAAEAALEALHLRIQAARSIGPAPRDRHCLDCFQRGRDAAIRAILGE